MDNVRKVVVFLLILSIIFSVAAIAINFSLSANYASQHSYREAGGEGGKISLVVEGNSNPSVEESG